MDLYAFGNCSWDSIRLTLLWFSFNLPEFMILSIFRSWTQLLFSEESLLLLINSFILLLAMSAFLLVFPKPLSATERLRANVLLLVMFSHHTNIFAFSHPF